MTARFEGPGQREGSRALARVASVDVEVRRQWRVGAVEA